MGRGNAVLDADGIRGSCSSCSEHFTPLLAELEGVLSPGHLKARKQWLWSHALSSSGEWIGHAQCLAKLTKADKETLSNLRRCYLEKSRQPRECPACMVLQDEALLKDLVHSGEQEPEEWSSLEVRRKWLKQKMVDTGNQRTPVFLLADSSSPPSHGNVFKKVTQKQEQFELFKIFVDVNSAPNGQQLRGETHYFKPTIRRIRPPAKLKEGASEVQRERYRKMMHESLTFQFNESLKAHTPPLQTVGHDTICRWLKRYFPFRSVVRVQSASHRLKSVPLSELLSVTSFEEIVLENLRQITPPSLPAMTRIRKPAHRRRRTARIKVGTVEGALVRTIHERSTISPHSHCTTTQQLFTPPSAEKSTADGDRVNGDLTPSEGRVFRTSASRAAAVPSQAEVLREIKELRERAENLVMENAKLYMSQIRGRE